MSERATAGSVLILTARMERTAFDRFDALRRAHFPPERNFLGAHVTLFHHLPGPEYSAIVDRLAVVARGHAEPVVDVTGLRSLGKGVAFTLLSPALSAVRAELAELWEPWLIPQDAQGFRPHVTVQNKVTATAARALLARLTAEFRPWRFIVEGLTLWRYDDGPWTRLKDVTFARG